METFTIKKLDWDTDFFGVSCARVALNDVLTEQEAEELLKQVSEYDFVTIENTCGAFSNDFYLGNKSNAYITDCSVTLKKKSQTYFDDAFGESKIRLATEEDLSWLTDIAGEAFINSRFYNDPRITTEQVSGLYTSWVKNAFRDANKTIFVTEDRNGFLIYLQDKDKAYINLIATGGENRKKGVGTALVKYADNYAFENGCEEFFVGTQATNIPAINLYIKCGFKLFKTTRIYHFRND